MGFSANSLGRLNLEIGYTIDESGLKRIQSSLASITAEASKVGASAKTGLQEAATAAKEFGGILGASINTATGQLNMERFATNLKASGMSLNQFATSLQGAGTRGQAAFSEINKQLMSVSQTAVKTEGIMGQLGKTFVNTFMYSFSYRIVGGFIKGVTDAINYVKELDKSLTNIQVVTKESTDQMDAFAKKANEAAKALGTSTKQYADASLIFAQQGLKGAERDMKTEATIKVANITDQDPQEVSQQLTALWNGYQIGAQGALEATDKLANVAAHSASSLSELATGMSKVAAAANTIGVSEDQLTAQLATIESVTREAPETIGTSLKTIYARLGDLSVEGVDEFGVGLGEVSGKLKQMGVEVLDSQGQMKDMGVVMDEVAGKWDTWTQAQKQAAAVAMAGKRQYTKLMALFENQDKYKMNLFNAENSEGEVDAQQQIYLDSIEGLKQKAKASWEEVYSNMFDSDGIKGFYEAFAGIGDAIANIGDALPIAGIVMIAELLQNKIVTGLTNVTLHLTKHAQQSAVIQLTEDMIATARERGAYVLNGQVMTKKQILDLDQSGAQVEEKRAALEELKDKHLWQRIGLSRQEQAIKKDIEEIEEQSLLTQSTKLATHRDIMQYAMQANRAQRVGNADAIVAQTTEQYKAELKQRQLEVAAGLTEEEQENLNMLIEQETALQEQLATYDMEAAELAELVGISEEEYNNITKKIGGQNELALKISEEAEKRATIAEQVAAISEEEINGVSIAERKAQIEEQIKEKLGEEALEIQIISEAIEKGNGDLGKTTEYIQQAINKAQEFGTTYTNATAKSGQNLKSIGVIADKGESVKRTQGLYQGLTSTMMGTAMAAMSLNSAIKSLQDPNTSGFEKFISILMSSSMVMMSVGQTWKGIQGLFSSGQAIFQKLTKTISNVTINTEALTAAMTTEKGITEAEASARVFDMATLDKHTAAKAENTLQSYLNASGTEAEMAAIEEDTFASLTNIFTKNGMSDAGAARVASLLMEIGATEGDIVATEADTAATITNYIVKYWWIAAILAVVAAFALLAWAIANQTSAQERHIEQLNESKAKLSEEREELSSLQEAYENLKTSITDLETAYASLDAMTKGTEEWKEKVQEVNNQVLELLDKYPQLMQYVHQDDDGVLRVDDEGYDKLLKDKQKGIARQQANVFSAQATVLENEQTVAADNAADAITEGLQQGQIKQEGVRTTVEESIKGAFSADTFIGKATEDIQDGLISKLGDGLSSIAAPFIDDIKSGFSPIADNFTDLLNDTAKDGINGFLIHMLEDNPLEAVNEGIEKAGIGFISDTVQLGSDIVDGVKSLSDTVVEKATDGALAIKKGATEVWNDISKDGFSGFLKNIPKAPMKVAEGVGSMVNSGIKDVTGIDIGAGLDHAGKSIEKNATEAFTDIKDSFGKTFDDIQKDGLKGLFSHVGKDNPIIDTVGAIGTGINDTVKDITGIDPGAIISSVGDTIEGNAKMGLNATKDALEDGYVPGKAMMAGAGAAAGGTIRDITGWDKAGDLVENMINPTLLSDSVDNDIGKNILGAIESTPGLGQLIGVAQTLFTDSNKEKREEKYAETIEKAAKDGSISSDPEALKSYLKDNLNMDIKDDSALSKIYEQVVQIKEKNDQQLTAFKEQAKAVREAEGIKFEGTGDTKEEKEANANAKDAAWDAMFASKRNDIETNWKDKQTDDDDIFSGVDADSNIYKGDDTDEDVTGENDKDPSKIYQDDLTGSIKEIMGGELSKQEEDYIKNTYKDSSDISAKHWLAQTWGVDASEISYDEDSHTFKDASGHERSFDDQNAIAQYVEKQIVEDVASAGIDKKAIGKLSTDQAMLVSNIGAESSNSIDVSKFTGSTYDPNKGLDKETKEFLEKQGKSEEEIASLEENLKKKYNSQIKQLDKSTKEIFESGKNVTLEQAQEADFFIKQEKEKGGSAIQTAYKNLEGEQFSKFTDMLKSVDMTGVDSVKEFKQRLLDSGVSVDEMKKHLDAAGLSFKDLMNSMKDLKTASDDVAGNFENFSDSITTYLQKIEKLKPGDSLSAEDYEAALANAQDKEGFRAMYYHDYATNSYILKEDVTDEQKKETTVGDVGERVRAGTKIQNAFGGDATNKDGTKLSSLHMFDADSTVGQQRVSLMNFMGKHDGEGGSKEQQDTIRNLENGKYAQIYDNYDKYVDKDSGEFIGEAATNESLQTEIKNYLKAIQSFNDDLKNGSFDYSKSDSLAPILQEEAGGSATAARGSAEGVFDKAEEESGKDIDKNEKKQAVLSAQSSAAKQTAEALGDTVDVENAFREEAEKSNEVIGNMEDTIKNMATIEMYSLTKGVEKLSGLWNNTYKDAKEGSVEHSKLMQESADTMNTIFQTDKFDAEWVKANKGLVKSIANGSKEGVRKGRIELAKLTVKKLKINFDKKGLKKDWNATLKGLSNTKFKVGAEINEVDDGPLIAVLQNFVKNANKTAAECEEIFNGMGWTFEYETDKDGKVTGIKTKNGKLVGQKFANDEGVDTKSASDKGKDGSDSGGGDEDKPNYTYETTDKNDIDHLHDLKQAMEDLNSTLSKLKTQQDKVFGKSLIKNLNDQNKLIEQQNKNLKAQIKIQTKDLGQSQTDMRKLFGFKFNKKTGRISNYKKILNERYKAYADYIKQYNKLSAKQQEGKKGKTLLAKRDKAKTKWDEAKTAVSEYDTLFNERQSNIDKTIENFNAIADNNIKKLHAMAEALELTTQLEQNALDYEKDLEHSSKDRAYQSEYNLKTSQIEKKKYQENLKEVQTLEKELDKMVKKGWDKKYGTNFKSMTEALAKAQKNLIENLKKIQQGLIDDIKLISENYKDFNEEVEKTDKTFKHLTNTLDTYGEVSKMLYGDDEYGTQSEVAKEKYELYQGQVQTAQTRLSTAQDYLKDAQAAYQSALKSGSQEAIQTAKETLQSAQEAVQSATEAVNEAIKNQIKSLQDWYTAQVKDFFKDLEQSLTAGYGWDYLSKSIKRAKQYSDDWLDDAQRIGNMAELTASFEQEIAKASGSSANAQQKILQCKQEQLANLEKIDKLTQYDIDRARAKLSLTLKQIALEEARENKSKLRLKRDSQGNYSYQYSADQEAIAKAKEEYEKARLKLYEDDQKNLQNAISQLEAIEKEGAEELSKLLLEKQNAKTDEERAMIDKKIAQTKDYYERQRTNRKQNVDQARTYLEDKDSGLGYYNQAMGTNYQNAEEARRMNKEGFNKFFYGSEGLVPLSDAAYQMMNQSTKDWSAEVDKAIKKGKSAYRTYDNAVSDISNSVNGSLRSIIEGVDEHSGLINTKKYTDELNQSVDNSAKKYKTTAKRIQTNINKQSELFNVLNSKAAKKAIKKPKTMADNLLNAKANAKALYEYINNNKDLAIKPMEDMSTKARQLRDDWNGVYKAAKRAIAQESKSKGSDKTSGNNNNNNNNNNGLTFTNVKVKSKSIKSQNGGKAVTVFKGSDGKFYARKGGTAYSTKEKAAQESLKLSKNNGKIGDADVGSSLIFKDQHYNKPGYGIEYYTGPADNMKMMKTYGGKDPAHVGVKTIGGSKILRVSGNFVQLAAKKGVKSHWYKKSDIKKYFKGFDTGGYTGSWNSKSGKLALLHEKELVLNKKDTKNILNAVKLMRNMLTPIKEKNSMKSALEAASVAANEYRKNISNSSISNKNNNTQQSININASFPNATKSSEIEKAFQQLSAKATQYAWSNKIR